MKTDRVALHKRLDKWLDEVETVEPRLVDGDVMSITFSGGVDDNGWSENKNCELANISIETRRTETGI